MGNAKFVDVQTSPAIMGDGGLYLRISHVQAGMQGALLQTGQDRENQERMHYVEPLGPPPPRRGGVEVERVEVERAYQSYDTYNIYKALIRPITPLHGT